MTKCNAVYRLHKLRWALYLKRFRGRFLGIYYLSKPFKLLHDSLLAFPPSWMIFEVLSLGTVSQIFKNLAREHQKPIAKQYDLDVSIFVSWLHALSYLRNLAAHHQRLWNRRIPLDLLLLKRFPMTYLTKIGFMLKR